MLRTEESHELNSAFEEKNYRRKEEEREAEKGEKKDRLPQRPPEAACIRPAGPAPSAGGVGPTC